MNRRIRKKKLKGEFDYVGIDVTGEFKKYTDDDFALLLIDEFFDELVEFVENIDCMMGGGCCNGEFGFFISKFKNGKRNPHTGKPKQSMVNCEEPDRFALDLWFKEQTKIVAKSKCELQRGSQDQ